MDNEILTLKQVEEELECISFGEAYDTSDSDILKSYTALLRDREALEELYPLAICHASSYYHDRTGLDGFYDAHYKWLDKAKELLSAPSAGNTNTETI